MISLRSLANSAFVASSSSLFVARILPTFTRQSIRKVSSVSPNNSSSLNFATSQINPNNTPSSSVNTNNTSQTKPNMTRITNINVLKTVQEVREWRRQIIMNNKTLGMVPTMGALHQGHLNLVKRSSEENDYTLISIFVNPSQFGPTEDLDAYPRTLETDIEALSSVDTMNASINGLTVFAPSVQEMYPSGIPLEINKQRGAFVEVAGGLGQKLEGAIRPQFFRGVATIVTKLLNIATPDRAYFGQKDIQQLIVVKRMVKDLLIGTEIVMVPTVREDNQLAMSSRNLYLTNESRSNSSILYHALAAGQQVYNQGEERRDVIMKAIKNVLAPYDRSVVGSEAAKEGGFYIDVEYISLADKEELNELDTVRHGEGAVISAAIRVPNKSGTQTRIIDNILLD